VQRFTLIQLLLSLWQALYDVGADAKGQQAGQRQNG